MAIETYTWRYTAKEPSALGIHAGAWVFLVLLATNPFKYAIIEIPLFLGFIVLSGLSLYGRRKGVSMITLVHLYRFKIGKIFSYNNALMNGDLYEECRSIHHI